MKPRFDGSTYDPHLDCRRLSRQIDMVQQIMLDGKWRTLQEIKRRFPHPLEVSEAGISARLRDCRKERFGGYTVERRRRDKGLFEYRMSLKSLESATQLDLGVTA